MGRFCVSVRPSVGIMSLERISFFRIKVKGVVGHKVTATG